MSSCDHAGLRKNPQAALRAVPDLITRLFFGVRPMPESVLSSESLKSNGVSPHLETPSALDIQTNRSLPGQKSPAILQTVLEAIGAVDLMPTRSVSEAYTKELLARAF